MDTPNARSAKVSARRRVVPVPLRAFLNRLSPRLRATGARPVDLLTDLNSAIAARIRAGAPFDIGLTNPAYVADRIAAWPVERRGAQEPADGRRRTRGFGRSGRNRVCRCRRTPLQILPKRVRQKWTPVLSPDTRKNKRLESVRRFCHRRTDSKRVGAGGGKIFRQKFWAGVQPPISREWAFSAASQARPCTVARAGRYSAATQPG